MRKTIRAKRMLTLVDESNILLHDRRRSITAVGLSQFLTIQRQLSADSKLGELPKEWVRWTETLIAASESDLRLNSWTAPRGSRKWAIATQRLGRQRAGRDFQFLGFDLGAFGKSDVRSRRLREGNLSFAAPVRLGKEYVVFSASTASHLVGYRTDPDSNRKSPTSPYADHRFSNPNTRFFNLNWIGGAAKYFPGNAPQIFDFYAEKIARNIRAGKRTLLIARKRFIPTCSNGLQACLVRLGISNARVITENWDSHCLADPVNVPLINYGVSGINRFEEFDAAYCLMSYYANPEAIERTLQDLDPVDGGWRVEIRYDSLRGRLAEVGNPASRSTAIPALAQDILVQQEGDVIVQAIGRVRPFTKPREVITFHTGKLPNVDFDVEFDSLAQARAYFEVLSRRDADRSLRVVQAAHIQRRKAQGASNQQIATELGLSRRTVSRRTTQKW
ncbi:helix-turn-helix domain-containing protein [Anatilimnocola aggregata]|nr:helix-turn-helix domain-containing protein [Anatilimnocola aggregata]